MESEQLKQTLAKLHEELAAADRMDVESAEMLHQALDDINDALERFGEGVGDSVHGTQDRLEGMATRIDAEHPTLASLLRQLNAALSRMGI